MKFIISGKNIDVTPGLKDTITHKLGKLERYFTPDTEIIVTLSVEKERQKIEVTIPVKARSSGPSRSAAICMYPLILWRKSLNVSFANIKQS